MRYKKKRKKTKQKTKLKIKALIFDVGGVLQLRNPSFEHPNVHNYIAKKLGINLDQYFDSIDTAYTKSIEGKASEKRVLKIMARNLKITLSRLKKLYLGAYRKYYTLNKKLLEFIFRIRKQGYKTAILSDQWYLSKKALIPRDFYDKFDLTIVSCDVGIRKPNPEIYNLVLRKLKMKPEEVIFVDNQKWNIVPAKKLGMKTILFRNNKQATREISKRLK